MSSQPARGELIRTGVQAREKFEKSIAQDYRLSPATRVYYRETLDRIWTVWPTLERLDLARVTKDQCLEFANQLSATCGGSVFNNALLVLRRLFKIAGIHHDPTRELKRIPAPPRVYDVPTAEEFERICGNIERQPGRFGHDAADLARLLAFSGCRRGEARRLTWGDVDFANGVLTIRRGKQRAAGGSIAMITRLPMTQALKSLVSRMYEEQGKPEPSVSIARVQSCDGALVQACKRLGRQRLTHHGLRHCFVSWCLGAGVPVRIVADWVGHRDGGALILRTYAHVLQAHSAEWAAKLTLDGKAA
jgi:integrase